MTSQQYREKAEQLLNARTVGGDRPEGAIEEAAVWARLAQAAALTETEDQ